MKSFAALMITGVSAWSGQPWDEFYGKYCLDSSLENLGDCLKENMEHLSEDAKAAVATFDACANEGVELYTGDSLLSLRTKAKEGELSDECKAALPSEDTGPQMTEQEAKEKEEWRRKRKRARNAAANQQRKEQYISKTLF